MPKIKKIIIIWFVLFLFILPLIGCRSTASADNILEQILMAESKLPAGDIYSSNSDSDINLLTAELISVIWGNGSPPPAYKLVNTAAVFLPTKNIPFEIEILECLSTDGTYDVAVMCRERMDILSNIYSDNSHIKIQIIGRYVVCVLGTDADKIINTAKRVINN